MRARLIAALLCAAAAPPQPPTRWPLARYVRWQPSWGSRTIETAGVRVRIDSKQCGVDRPTSEGCGEGSRYLTATVQAQGIAPVTVQGSPGVAAYMGIGRLRPRDRWPSLILISEDGGSGGCVQIDVAAAGATGFRVTRLGPDAREHGTLCEVEPARLAWPRALTGHGRPELLLADTRFYCQFTSCAGSWYPPRIIGLTGPRGLDVSDDPTLAPLYRRDMARARYACEHAKVEPQGACAGYAADAARLGVLQEAWRVIDGQVRRGCRAPGPDPCPVGYAVLASFPEELAPTLSATARR